MNTFADKHTHTYAGKLGEGGTYAQMDACANRTDNHINTHVPMHRARFCIYIYIFLGACRPSAAFLQISKSVTLTLGQQQNLDYAN